MEKIFSNQHSKLIIIIILGVLVRFLFILLTPIYQYQFDLGINKLKSDIDYENLYNSSENILPCRDFEYILTLYETGKLPTTNSGQFYHPPLNFIILAFFLKIMSFMPFSAKIQVEALQLLPLIYSSITLVFIKKIMNQLEFSSNIQSILLLFFAFNPLFVILSGCLNNDSLIILFSTLSLYYLIKWYKNSNIKDTIKMSVFIALGGITKSSILVSVLICGIIFIIKLFNYFLKYQENKINIKKISLHFLLFFVITIPFIMAYPIRNYLLFHQPIFGVKLAHSYLYIGNHSYFERFRIFTPALFYSFFTNTDFNLFAYSIKSNINFFGNFNNSVFLVAQFILILLLFISIIGNIIIFFTQKNKRNYQIFCITTILSWIISVIIFNISLPYSCSMHARYIYILITFLVIQLGFILKSCKHKLIRYLIGYLIILYSVLSLFILWQHIF